MRSLRLQWGCLAAVSVAAGRIKDCVPKKIQKGVMSWEKAKRASRWPHSVGPWRGLEVRSYAREGQPGSFGEP